MCSSATDPKESARKPSSMPWMMLLRPKSILIGGCPLPSVLSKTQPPGKRPTRCASTNSVGKVFPSPSSNTRTRTPDGNSTSRNGVGAASSSARTASRSASSAPAAEAEECPAATTAAATTSTSSDRPLLPTSPSTFGEDRCSCQAEREQLPSQYAAGTCAPARSQAAPGSSPGSRSPAPAAADADEEEAGGALATAAGIDASRSGRPEVAPRGRGRRSAP
mmetsp:Transcript_165784/g.532369  ORF Transcript_165784/g.532369 Transcript_165784/m.532369 type:complete len:221 (+) Transcript_165784:1391-2053(+)